MSLLRVVTVFDQDSAVLRQKARKIKRFGPELAKLAQDMLETMHASNGIGLAAPQVGLSIRLFVVEIPQEEGNPQSGKPYVFVNPKIIRKSHEEVLGEEGCLSIPGIYGDVWRAAEVIVRAQDPYGKEFKMRARDLLARVILHEYDHLEGILFIDYIGDPAQLRQYVEKDGELVAQPARFPAHLIRPRREPVPVR